MNRWNKVKEFETTTVIHGITVPVLIRIEATDDDCSVDGSFDFGNEEENAAYMRRFETCELWNALIRVTAMAEGESGTDYLGGCHVVSSRADAEIMKTANDHGMAKNATAELVKEIVEKAKRLQKYA